MILLFLATGFLRGLMGLELWKASFIRKDCLEWSYTLFSMYFYYKYEILLWNLGKFQISIWPSLPHALEKELVFFSEITRKLILQWIPTSAVQVNLLYDWLSYLLFLDSSNALTVCQGTVLSIRQYKVNIRDRKSNEHEQQLTIITSFDDTLALARVSKN